MKLAMGYRDYTVLQLTAPSIRGAEVAPVVSVLYLYRSRHHYNLHTYMQGSGSMQRSNNLRPYATMLSLDFR